MNKTTRLLCVAVISLMILCTDMAFGEDNSGESPLTEENPIRINEKAGTLSFLAEVNGKQLSRPTRHFAVFKGGTLGNKGILRALIDHETFYESLKKIGAEPGNNMTFENGERTHVQGTELDVSVTWKGADKKYRLDEVIKDSNGKPIRMRFGGNLSNAIKYNSGCLFCLDSCPVGIASNATYTYGSVEKRRVVTFVGRKDLLPPDGTLVIVEVKPKEQNVARP